MTVQRITKDGLLLALLCVTGMLSLPLGENIKVSLQLLTLFIIFGVTDKLLDKIIIPTLYLLIGLLIPVYAGFQAGITPTFGFVISFVVIAVPFHFIYKYIKINRYVRYIIACVICLLIVYVIGTLFLMLYLKMNIGQALLVAVVPYIGFDVGKIALATIVIRMLPEKIKGPDDQIKTEQE